MITIKHLNTPALINEASAFFIYLFFMSEKDRCYDIQKIAIKENYAGKGKAKHLFLACFKLCQENQYHALGG